MPRRGTRATQLSKSAQRIGDAMKHKLNLNGPSARFLPLIAILLVLLPLGLHLLGLLLRAAHLPAEAIPDLVWASVAVALAMLAAFALLIVAEHIQDARMDRLYWRGRHHKTPLADGRFECQYCGNRQPRAADRSCPVCGKALE